MSNIKVTKKELIETLDTFKETFYEYSDKDKLFNKVNKYKDLFTIYRIREMIEDFINYNYKEDCCKILYKMKDIEDIEDLDKFDGELIEVLNDAYNNNLFIITTFEYNSIIFKQVNPEILKEFLSYFKYILLYLPKQNRLIFTTQDIFDLYTILRFLNIITEEESKSVNPYEKDLSELLNIMKNKIIDNF